MKSKFIALLLVLALILAIPAYAATPRTVDIVPDIVFSGNKATCTARITGDRVTDQIAAKMTLKQGSRVINEWSDSGRGILKLTGNANVSRLTTYTLTVSATINGVTRPAVTITRTNK